MIIFQETLEGEVRLWNIVQLQCFTHYLALFNFFFFFSLTCMFRFFLHFKNYFNPLLPLLTPGFIGVNTDIHEAAIAIKDMQYVGITHTESTGLTAYML